MIKKIVTILQLLIMLSGISKAQMVLPATSDCYLSGSKTAGSVITFSGAASHDNDYMLSLFKSLLGVKLPCGTE